MLGGEISTRIYCVTMKNKVNPQSGISVVGVNVLIVDQGHRVRYGPDRLLFNTARSVTGTAFAAPISHGSKVY